MTKSEYDPMLAKGGPLTDKHVIAALDDPNYSIIQEKKDGIRYIYIKPLKGKSKMHSRISSKKSENGDKVDKSPHLKFIIEELDKFVPAGTVLDGEIFIDRPGATSKEVTKYTGCLAQESWDRQKRDGFPLRYVVWDILARGGVDVTNRPYSDRLTMLNWHIDNLNRAPYYTGLITTSIKTSREQAIEIFAKILENGGEGIMLKDETAPYYVGKRHKAWVKVKNKMDFDVVFMGITDAKEESVKKGDTAATKTKYAGMAGAIKYGQYKLVKQCRCMHRDKCPSSHRQYDLVELGTTSGFCDAERADLTKNWMSYIGRVFEVSAQLVYEDTNAPRHPRTGKYIKWRDDKPATDCILGSST